MKSAVSITGNNRKGTGMKKFLLSGILLLIFFTGCGKNDVAPCQKPINFHAVAESPGEPDCTVYPDPYPDGGKHLVKNRPELSVYKVKNASAYCNEFGQNMVRITLFPDDAEKFSELTERHVGRQIAIIIDGKLFCAPFVRERINSENIEISGNFSKAEAELLAGKLYPEKRKNIFSWMQ